MTDDPLSMGDLQLYLMAGKDVIHREWVIAAAEHRDTDSADLRRAWEHIYQAHGLINNVNRRRPQEKD